MVANEEDAEEDIFFERWVMIQKATFTNWVNDKLSSVNMNLENITTDFKTGVTLCHLIESLQDRSIGKIINKKVMNHYEGAGNLQLAMEAMTNDNIKLVNIGVEDIAGGNLKLILGMLWTLIRHYQIGHVSKLPPKKYMLLLVNAILKPHKKVTNFNTDWNNGIALMGLVEFCQPGSFTNWYSRNRHLERSNCEEALEKAHESLGIPIVLDPDHFASHEVDELSVMTYLSYFFTVGSPVHTKLMKWLQEAIHPIEVTNFGSDWKDGQIALALAYVTGALQGRDPPELDSRQSVENCTTAIKASKSIGVPDILNEKDMCVVGGNYNISLMAYVAWHYVSINNLKRALPRIIEEEENEEYEELVAAVDKLDSALMEESIEDESEEEEVIIKHNSINLEEAVEIESEAIEAVEKIESAHIIESVETQPKLFHVEIVEDIAPEKKEPIWNNSPIICIPINQPQLLQIESEKDRQAATKRRSHEELTLAMIHSEKKLLNDRSINSYENKNNLNSNFITTVNPASHKVVLSLSDEVDNSIKSYVSHDQNNSQNASENQGQDEYDEIIYEDLTLLLFKNNSDFPSNGNSEVSGTLVNAYGEGLADILIDEDIVLNSSNSIQIKGLNTQNGATSVIAVSPSGNKLVCDVSRKDDVYIAHFVPNEKGRWQILVEQDNRRIVNANNQPIYVTVFNPIAGKLIRSHFGPVGIGQYYGFEVDCLDVGTESVNLDVKIVHNKKPIDCQWENVGIGKCKVGFIPKLPGKYEANVYCGGIHFPGSPFTVEVSGSQSIQASGSGLQSGIIHGECEFQIDATSCPGKECEIVITSPSNKIIPFTIDQIKNLITVTYIPLEIGVTTIEIGYNKSKLDGSPFDANIREPNIYVKRILKDVYVGQKCSMEVDASEHSKGTIEIDSSLPVLSFEKLRERVYLINFLPKMHGLQDIILKFDNHIIPGSPFQVTVKKHL